MRKAFTEAETYTYLEYLKKFAPKTYQKHRDEERAARFKREVWPQFIRDLMRRNP